MKHSKLLFKSLSIVIIAFVISSCNGGNNSYDKNKDVIPFDVNSINEINNPRNVSQQWRTDTLKRSIPLIELTALLKRNRIKPISNPKFITNDEVKDSLFLGQPVIAIELNGESRCYPLNMLSYHEIVNDSIGNTLISVAYCPLCNTAYVFNRKLKHDNKEYTLKFGTSGMLRMSNLVMWDEQTETWWQHITGEGIVGELAKAKLEILPAKIISLGNYVNFYPDGTTLFPDINKKHKVNYEHNNYHKYDSLGVEKPFLFYGKVDKRLPAMEYIIGVENGSAKKAFPLSTLESKRVINSKVGDKNIVVFYNPDMISNLDAKDIKKGKRIGSGTVFNSSVEGRVFTFTLKDNLFIDNETGSLWNFVGECVAGNLKGKKLLPEVYGFDFAFAYLSFYPHAKIYSD